MSAAAGASGTSAAGSETAHAAIPSGVPSVPPPWNVKAQAWWFVTSVLGKPLKKDEPFPPGHFLDRQKRERELAQEDGAFKGGLGAVLLFRYTESPGGPYDELMMIPGVFTHPSGEAFRITRIYVSTMFALVNGREHWNTAKELAKFTFTPAPGNPRATEVRIFAAASFEGETPVFAPTPFFAAVLDPSCLPAIPCNLKYSPIRLAFAQPPLEESPDAAHDGGIGTDRWVSFAPGFSGRVKAVTIKGLLEDDDAQKRRIADGKGFPDIKPYSCGIFWPQVDVVFPEIVPILQPQT